MQRRSFLTLFSASALAAIAPLDQLVSYQGRRFVSPAFGLSLAPPRRWHRPDLDEVIRDMQRQTLQDEGLEENEAPAPLTAFYKYPEPHPDMNPGVWIYADRAEPWMGTPMDLAANYLDSYSEVILDPVCLQLPTPIEIAGCPGAAVTLQHRLVIASEAFEHVVTDHSFILIHRGHLIWLVMQASRNGPEQARREFDEVLASVRLT